MSELADGGRDRPANGRHGRGGGAAARYRPCHLGRRRSGRARPAPSQPRRPSPCEGRARGGGGARGSGGLVLPRVSAGRGLHRSRRRVGRLSLDVPGTARLFRLDRHRGRAGSGKGPPRHLCEDGVREPEAVHRRGGPGTVSSMGVMTMSKLRVRPNGTHGRVISVTPESAGWSHVGFDLHRLGPGERVAAETGDREACLVLVSGKARIEAGGHDFGVTGERMSPFEGKPPSIYVPAGSHWRVGAGPDLTLAVLTAPRGAGPLPPRPIELGQGARVGRGW